MKTIVLAGVVLLLAACSPAFQAAEKAVETRVDAGVDVLIERMCKGPVDVAIRTFERHPALGRAAFEVCPETYGRLRAMLLDDAIERVTRP